MEKNKEIKIATNEDCVGDDKKVSFNGKPIDIGINEITLFCDQLSNGELYLHQYKESNKAYYTQWILKNGNISEKSRKIKSTNPLAVSNSPRDNQLKNEAKSLVNTNVEEHLIKAGRYISNNLKTIFPSKSFLERSIKDTQLIQMANDIEKTEKIVVHRLTGDLYKYNKNKGYYQQFDQKQFAQFLNRFYKEKFLADEVQKILGTFTKIKTESNGFIALNNCLLDLSTLETKPFSNKKFVTFQVPYDWNPESKSKFFETKLKEILVDDERFKLFLQIVGYCFTQNNSHHKMFFITGEGSNGKSTLMAIIRAIFHDSIAAVGLHEFKNDFGLQPLLGKRINILYDLPKKTITDTGHIKAVTGEDLITINRKHKEPVTTVLGCKIIGVGNYLPPVRDDTYAFWRRVQLIELTNTFKENKIVKLEEKLVSDIEGMEWLIYQSIEAYKNVQTEGWACTRTEEDNRTEYLLKSDPCLYAAEELFKKTNDPNDYISREETVNIISDYLNVQNIELPKDIKLYYSAIRRLGGADIDKSINGGKIRCFAYIKPKMASDYKVADDNQAIVLDCDSDEPKELEYNRINAEVEDES